jgi:hypothetical protein
MDVFMVDWGVPDERDADNDVETYVDEYLPRAIRAVAEGDQAATRSRSSATASAGSSRLSTRPVTRRRRSAT